jgi:DNA-binding response OmpR family regulator
MRANNRVLVADDDKILKDSLCEALAREGFEAVPAHDGLAALEITRARGDLCLVVADIGMPRMDGIEFLRRLREDGSQLPFMFLTSRDEEFDRVLGLELGADDYLTKPFSIRELMARIRAVLRRYRPSGEREGPGERAITRAGRLLLDEGRFIASWEGRELALTLTEFRILASLARSPGTVKTRETLLSDAYPEDSYLSDRAIDCHIKRLRRKLSEARAPEDLIETIYGLGYRYTSDGVNDPQKGSAP